MWFECHNFEPRASARCSGRAHGLDRSRPQPTVNLQGRTISVVNELLRMRSVPILAAMVALLGLSGCNFRGTPDPSLSKRDAEWMALTPQAELDPLFARYVIDDPTREAPGHRRGRHQGTPALFRAAQGQGGPLWRDGRRRGVRLDRHGAGRPQGRMAELVSAGRDGQALAVCPCDGGQTRQPARRSRALPLRGQPRYALSHPRHQRAEKIGTAASSGCIRMRNIDVVDLYNRVTPDTKVIVR